MAPLAGNPQKMHMVSIKFLKKGSVTISSTVLWRESNVKGKSKKTSGCVATKGRLPAVVAKKPASCRRFNRETAVVDPPRVLSRARRLFHSYGMGSDRMLDSIWCRKPPPSRNSSTYPNGLGAIIRLFHQEILEL